MDQFNDRNPDRHEKDHDDILFEDDPSTAAIFKIKNLPENFPEIPSLFTDSQVLLGYQVDIDSSSPYNESDPISQMLRNLEKSVINEKDAEIIILRNELKEKNKEIEQITEKLIKLKDYISFVHDQVGKLLRGMMVMEVKDKTNILHFGPFKSETAKTEFIQNLNVLSANFLSDYENFTRSRVLLWKINMILRSKENLTNKQSTNISTNQVHSSGKIFNGGVNCASTFTQAIPLLPPLNMTRPSDMPPPISSTQKDPPPANDSISQELPQPPPPLNLTMRRPPLSISRNSLQADYGINLATANKKHGIDHSKGHWGFFCLCNTRFSCSGKLKDHIQYFTMKKFECVICKKRYHKPSLLKLHMISSHKLECLSGGMLTCSICHENFGDWNIFREHLHNFHGIEKRHTTIKQIKFANGSAKHARDVCPEIPHGCTCGKKYSNKYALTYHIRTYMYGKVFKCSWCSEKFYIHNQLKRHASKIHGMERDKQNKFGCCKCGETFRTSAELREHGMMDVHH